MLPHTQHQNTQPFSPPPLPRIVPIANGCYALWGKSDVVTGPGSPNDGTFSPGQHRALPWLTVKYVVLLSLATVLDIWSSWLLVKILSTIADSAFSCAQRRKDATAAMYWFLDGSRATNTYSKTNWVPYGETPVAIARGYLQLFIGAPCVEAERVGCRMGLPAC